MIDISLSIILSPTPRLTRGLLAIAASQWLAVFMFQLGFVQPPLHDSTIMNILSSGAMSLQLMLALLCHAAHTDMCQK